ncbi:MAG: hypothetical protein ACR2HY_09970 [Acidimicrobiales bacterium]
MSEYESLIQEAEAEAAQDRCKEAYLLLGRALTIGGADDWRCRYLRGVYALRVASTRLDRAESLAEPGIVLVKAGCWLSRSEAYLTSAADLASGDEQAEIFERLTGMRREQDRFRQLWWRTPVNASRFG